MHAAFSISEKIAELNPARQHLNSTVGVLQPIDGELSGMSRGI